MRAPLGPPGYRSSRKRKRRDAGLQAEAVSLRRACDHDGMDETRTWPAASEAGEPLLVILPRELRRAPALRSNQPLTPHETC
jgi:hypothetical protein